MMYSNTKWCFLAPFYMQSNPPIPWNNYDYSYTRPPPHNMIPQTPTSWTPTQQAHTLKNPPIERDSRGSNHHPPHPPQTGPSESGDCWNNAVVAWEQQRTINNKVGLIVNERFAILYSELSNSRTIISDTELCKILIRVHMGPFLSPKI